MNTFETFKELNLPELLGRALENMEFKAPTPVQAAAIPAALSGKDILATAQTGTGKTGAFGIPLLTALAQDQSKGALILAPTRELAAQIHDVIKTMGRGQKFFGALLIGGESFDRQARDIERGVDYIIATPGRLNDHIERGTVNLGGVGFVVLDEVDRMLDMGFAPQIKKVMQSVPKARQTLLFSATLPKEIQGLANSLLNDPVRVAIGNIAAPVSLVSEKTMTTTDQGKNALILEELKARDGKVIVFARTKHRTDRLARLLTSHGHKAVSLHGGRTQQQRKKALDLFRTGSYRVMVATDLAGRGIDIEDIQHVINFDVPATREDYIHRIGRTGRFGTTGNALNFLVAGDKEGAGIYSGEKNRPSPHGTRPKKRFKPKFHAHGRDKRPFRGPGPKAKKAFRAAR